LIREGGLPALGVQGICPKMVVAPTRVALNSRIAAPASSSRLRTTVGVVFLVTIQQSFPEFRSVPSPAIRGTIPFSKLEIRGAITSAHIQLFGRAARAVTADRIISTAHSNSQPPAMLDF
jgi:hypothetical protein